MPSARLSRAGPGAAAAAGSRSSPRTHGARRREGDSRDRRWRPCLVRRAVCATPADAGCFAAWTRLRAATSSSVRLRPARQFLDGAAVEIARREIHVAQTRCRRRSTSSTRLMRSTSSVQSTSEIRRMLVMMLRTVTVAAPCLWCSSRTTASAVVPCAARCWSSQVSAGVTLGSWSRSR